VCPGRCRGSRSSTCSHRCTNENACRAASSRSGSGGAARSCEDARRPGSSGSGCGDGRCGGCEVEVVRWRLRGGGCEASTKSTADCPAVVAGLGVGVGKPCLMSPRSWCLLGASAGAVTSAGRPLRACAACGVPQLIGGGGWSRGVKSSKLLRLRNL